MGSPARGRPLTTVKGFIDRVGTLKLPDGNQFFFRGHSNKDAYLIKPSVFRKPESVAAEHLLFRELISTNPAEFREDTSTLERLARMQHHSCPTRLLDISSNPLVALYFACTGSPDTHGEVIVLRVRKDIIKFFDSDTVSCIANLARVSSTDKAALIKLPAATFNEHPTALRLLHFIKEEKPYFEPKIIKDDLLRVVVVRPKLNSRRILAQAGAFLLFGQLEEIDNTKVDGIEVERIIIDRESKPKIVKSLDLLNINEGSLYLDIDSYAGYLKRRYGL
jgi:hypothetical protein